MFILSSCTPSKEDAMNYNDKIINEQNKIIESEKVLIIAIKDTLIKESALEPLLKNLSNQIIESKKTIEGMDKFNRKTDFKDAALKFLNAYSDVVDNQYTAWLKILKIPDDQLTEDVANQEDKLVNTINTKLNNANDEFVIVQKEFAAKYKFKLAEK